MLSSHPMTVEANLDKGVSHMIITWFVGSCDWLNIKELSYDIYSGCVMEFIVEFTSPTLLFFIS